MLPGLSYSEKLIGSKPIKFTGSGAHAIPTGYQCWGVLIRVDATKITSISQNKSGTSTAYTSGDSFVDSWLNATDLLSGDFIVQDTPMTSITLNAATDSVWCFCEPFLGYHS